MLSVCCPWSSVMQVYCDKATYHTVSMNVTVPHVLAWLSLTRKFNRVSLIGAGAQTRVRYSFFGLCSGISRIRSVIELRLQLITDKTSHGLSICTKSPWT